MSPIPQILLEVRVTLPPTLPCPATLGLDSLQGHQLRLEALPQERSDPRPETAREGLPAETEVSGDGGERIAASRTQVLYVRRNKAHHRPSSRLRTPSTRDMGMRYLSSPNTHARTRAR